jgi:uncharacterized sulfatase
MRTFRFLTVVAFAVSLTSIVRAETKPFASTKQQPNILFAFADDMGRYASAYAKIEPGGLNDIISTPNFDRVAKEGALFRNAFVNAPSCTPCRSSLLSGQYFWRTGRGAILQGAIWDTKIPSYPLILRDVGYHIGHSYKVWSPGTPANAPYGAKETSYNKRGNRFSGYSQFVSKADDQDAARKTLLDEVRGNFQDFLADRLDGQSFCYWFGPTNVHRKWTQGSGKKLWGLNPDDLKGKVPPFLPDVPIVREDIADYFGEIHAFDAGLGVLLDELEKLGELDNTLIVVSGDHGAPGFPYGKCNLYDFGVAVPLAVRWPGKVPADRVIDDFVCLPDLAPTFIDAASLTPPDVMTGRSLLPILKSTKSGQIDATRDAVIVGRERHVAAARTDNMPYPQRAIRTKDFLYIRNFKPDRWPMGTAAGYGAPAAPWPDFNTLANNTFGTFGDLDASPTKAWLMENYRDGRNGHLKKEFEFAFGRRPGEELYDLRTDPHQIKNVAAESAYREVKTDLSDRLIKILKETGDPRVTGDGSTFDKPPYSGKWVRPQRKPAQPKKKKAA